jgi:hypothetical protein
MSKNELPTFGELSQQVMNGNREHVLDELKRMADLEGIETALFLAVEIYRKLESTSGQQFTFRAYLRSLTRYSDNN